MDEDIKDKEDSKEQTDDVILEAYASAERVKKEILDRRMMINYYLSEFILKSSNRTRNTPRKWNPESVEAFRRFQVAVLSLYEYIKPNIKNSKKKDNYKDLEKLDTCFLDLYKSDKKLKPSDWIKLSHLLTAFVYDLGVTKIELDIKAREREGLVWER